MLIGEFARRLRVSARTLRHYEAIGLLAPATVDATTGYRHYGEDEFVRGLQIEQLKAAGLPLADIAAVLADPAALPTALARQRTRLEEGRRELATRHQLIERLLADGGALGAPRLERRPAVELVTTAVSCPAGELTAAIRREIQRLRRRLKALQPYGSWTFGARLPLDLGSPDGGETPIEVEIGATARVGIAGSSPRPATTVVQVDLRGPYGLLPLAYDAVLATIDRRGLSPVGWVEETYVELGPAPRTVVAVAVAG